MEVTVELTTLEDWKEVRVDEAFLCMKDELEIIEATAMVDGILNVLYVAYIRNVQPYLFLNTTEVARVEYNFGVLKVFRTRHGDNPVHPLTIRVSFSEKESPNES